MHALIVFYKKNRVLTSFPYPIEKPDDYVKAIEAAYEQFRKDNPNVSLFDGVSVTFERVEVAPTNRGFGPT